MEIRPRRNRKSPFIRDLVCDHSWTAKDLIAPYFLIPKESGKEELKTMPGVYRVGLDSLSTEIEDLMKKGLRGVCLFPVCSDDMKDKEASYSYDEKNFYLKAARKLKQRFPELVLISDAAMDPYSVDGHDGFVNESGVIENDRTLEILERMSLAQADAGFDLIGPSDMMDGRVERIRTILDLDGFSETGIISYTAKYASAYYGPFREALDSAPKAGDKKTYQMDFRNKKEALRELSLDEMEGADIVMVKPGLAYLDIVSDFKRATDLPVAVYNVSGEYAMTYFAAKNGAIDLSKVVDETLTCFKRAGADIILSYFTPYALRELQ